MRWIGFGLTLLIATLLLADRWCEDAPIASQPSVATPWRRTAQGWQHVDQWTTSPSDRGGSLHPLVLAAGLLLGTLCVLVAFAPKSPPRRGQTRKVRAAVPLASRANAPHGDRSRRNPAKKPSE